MRLIEETPHANIPGPDWFPKFIGQYPDTNLNKEAEFSDFTAGGRIGYRKQFPQKQREESRGSALELQWENGVD